ncbi:amidase [Devosia aquimaris]|uniref:amidase n=1 Tax=Devosia aquimaris TaxID=2866214 RepID=UPI001CD0ABCA|nr:amidase [Devosia sp. CJK-A8-3]
MAQGGAFDDRFKAALQASGLDLSQDEAAGVSRLSRWLHEGLSSLPGAPDADPSADLCDLDIAELARRLRAGRLTSQALVRATLSRIKRRDPAYRSFYLVLEDAALGDAARADEELAQGIDRGPLHGIPVGIKDLIDVAGLPTSANAPGRAQAIADHDAEVVRRLRTGGAIILGKLATYEWATVGPDKRGLFPPARNPWKLDHITGGSSSGCAAAVAGGLLRTSVGTDTGGSVRGPSFYCGTVGLKPTYGLVPTVGVLDLAPSLDCVGPVSATVAEAAITLDVLSGRSGGQGACSRLGEPISGLSIGYARNWFAGDPQTMPEVTAAIDAAVSLLSAQGARISEVDMPDYEQIEVAVAAILHAESYAIHAESLRAQPEAYGRGAFLSLAAGMTLSEADVSKARAAGVAFTASIDELLDQHDVLVTVGALTTALPAAPFEKEVVWTPMRTIGFNVSGHPVLAIPVGFHDGLPIGMQIIGRHHAEARIVQFGHAFEQATDVSLQKAPVPH